MRFFTIVSAGITIVNAGLSLLAIEANWEPPGPSNRRTGLAISEIHYHPELRADGRDLQFVEIYNSHPWVEELGGYRLTGDVDFTFPPGTTIAAKGRVVIARVPADMQAVYPITGVLGPFAGALSNEGGTLRLRKPSDAIVQEVSWNDQSPWPVAPDGTAHSLVLVRPSYGENDPRAWAASPLRGGSPGAGDTAPANPEDFVVINEVLARSELPFEDFVELHNHSASSVDLSGCTLSDDPAALGKFVIPPGTVLTPGGFLPLNETQLGFAFAAQGETLYLSNAAGTRVLDAVRFGGQATNISIGRSPDGEGDLRPLVNRTAGAPNSPLRTSEILISELFFNPISGDELDEWLELTNPGAVAIDVTGWRFTDGIDFVIPAGTTIGAGGHLVVAKNAARTRANHPALEGSLVVGDYSGSLGDSGDQVTLVRPETVNTLLINVEVDSVRYTDASRWSRWADGGGSSLEVVDLRADRAFPGAWRDSDESAKAAWTTVSVSGPLDHGHPAVSSTDGGANRVQLLLMDAGEALVDDVVVLSNTGANVLSNGTFETGIGGWTLQGNHVRSSLAAGQGFGGGNALLVRASGDGDPEGNRIFAPLVMTLPPSSTGTVTAKARWLRGHPEMIARLKGGYLEAFGALPVPKNLGTPGQANSGAVGNAGPLIADVTHRPLLPTAGAEIRVFARLSDPDGVGLATLRWRLETVLTFTDVPMRDDGISPDTLAGDGIFAGAIPGQISGRLVVFRVQTTDAAPAPATAIFPPDAPTHECLVRVGDPAQAGDLAAYRFWLTAGNISTWSTRPRFSDEPLDVTFIYNNTRAVYGGGAWYGGSEASTPQYASPFNTSPLPGYNLTLPADDLVLAEDHFTLDPPVRDPTDQREQLMFWMAEQLRLPNLYRRYVHLFINGQRRSFIYDDVQQPDQTLLDEFFSGDSDGHLYKTNNWNEGADDGNSVTAGERNILKHYDTGGQHKLARYRWNWRPRAGDSANEFGALFTLIDAVNATSNYRAAVEAQIDVENWMRTFAFHDLCSYWDSFGNPNYKNTYLYKPLAGRWTQFTWDMDVGLGVFNDPVNAELFPSAVDPKVFALQAFPAFRRIYWQTMSEAFAKFFSGPGVTSQLQRKYNALVANGVGVTSPFIAGGAYGLTIPQWIDQRRAFIQSQFNSVNGTFAITSPADVTVTIPTVTITGTAPLTAQTLTVNGLPLPVTWTTLTAWSITLVPASGTHPYLVRAADYSGAQVGAGTVNVTYTGTSAWPAIRIDEWLAANDGFNADPAGGFDDWIELYNPTAAAIALGGWILADSSPAPGASYVIPNGFTIPAGGRLVVWCDDETVQSGTPDNLHVPFKLASSGETLLLKAPDGTIIDTVTFAQQFDNVSQGHSGDSGGGISYLSAATPGTANASAAPLPGIALAKTGTTVTLTLTVLPNFRYQIEYKDDLAAAVWTPLSAPVTATGSSLIFTDPNASGAQRFYRAVRTP